MGLAVPLRPTHCWGSQVKDFDTRAYSIADFLEWHSSELLTLSSDFQRRAVWSPKAKSYLIDTIIRGRPIPKILISQELRGSRNMRIVVDGQQRLRAILEFINGDFAISRAHNTEYARARFSSLSNEDRSSFLQYELGVDVLFNMQYSDLLDVFARINSYTVSLNKQEKLNAKYLGYFKQRAFSLGYQYVAYFLRSTVLTKPKVTRMGEAELASDLLVALVDGVQTNKAVEKFYKKYDDEPGPLDKCCEKFERVMSYLGEVYSPEDLAGTNWSRIHLFYSLFTAIAHCLYGLGGLEKVPRVRLRPSLVGRLRVRLDEVSDTYDEVSTHLNDKDAPADYKEFIQYSRRGTTDTGARVSRAAFVCAKLAGAAQ
ncbi:MAG: hypothetical protein DHS20C15_27710 [Planctomycetota bacterium]|nr:MAG: hypothetical protein DHS20C15_27710 [Planctomycetota bacterium]